MALSSAFFGFFGHTGFVRALQDAGIRPVLYGGASAGAMVAAAAAAGRLEQFGDVALDLKRRDFWDPGVPFGAPPGLLRGRRLAALLERHLPARFDDCATPLVTVSTNLTRRRRHVDTTGALPEAVLASSASPILFKPAASSTWTEASSIDLVRDDAWRHQAALAEARGVEVQVLEGPTGRLSPFSLGAAPDVMAEAERTTAAWLDEPARLSSG